MVYLDNNATTPVADEVRAAMQDALSADFANPSSPYTPARRVSAARRKAREQVAALIGAEPDEVLFTRGGTESNNTVLNTMLGPGAQRRHVVTTAVEHPSVLRSCDHLATFGHRVSRLAVDALRHATSPDAEMLAKLHQHALHDDQLSEAERREIKQLLNATYYPVKLANWLALTVPYGWTKPKALRLVEIISDFLGQPEERARVTPSGFALHG